MFHASRIHPILFSRQQRILPISHLIPVPKADSTITIEITPEADWEHNLTLFLRYTLNPKKKYSIIYLFNYFYLFAVTKRYRHIRALCLQLKLVNCQKMTPKVKGKQTVLRIRSNSLRIRILLNNVF